MTTPTPVLNLTSDQLAELTRLETLGQYPAMYLYLKTQVDTALQAEVSLNTVAVIDEIAALPELWGMGNVASLRQAMFQKPRDPIKRQHLVNKRHDRRIAA